MSRTRTIRLSLAITVLLAAAAGLGLSVNHRTEKVAPSSSPSRDLPAAQLEERYGIKLQRIAVTGAGGLVELRFTILDPLKARALLNDKDRAVSPSLIAEDTGNTLQAPRQGTWRNIRMQKDAACFVLFPNARSAVKKGTRVSLAFGTVRVEPVVAL